MNTHPRFTVRSYRAFRTARLYRVFVAPEALYFIRMKGLISASDAGSGHPHRPAPGRRRLVDPLDRP